MPETTLAAMSSSRARQRKCPITKFRPAPQTVQLSEARSAASLSRRLFGRISGQFCSM